jgi:ubiquinone/menaquinone biosynthesis C-methylase UbiE
MEEYYRKRALEYEEIYRRDDPARRKELRRIADVAKVHLDDKRVFEVACGTGFWTEKVSEVTDGIVGLDVSREMLGLARKKRYGCEVDFVVGDCYCPSFRQGWFDGGLANFWFSHVPKRRIGGFLRGLRSVLGEGSVVFMADNVHVPSVGGEFVRRSCEIDSYRLRRLRSGREFLVVKNYYSVEMLVDVLSPFAREFSSDNVWFGDCYWYVFFEFG